MHIDVVPNRKSHPTILLREAWREGHRICKKTLANLTDWPQEKVEALRRILAGDKLVSPSEFLRIERSTPHGHVELIVGMIRKIGLESVLASRRSRERDLVIGMIVERLIEPVSKLGTTRLWQTSTLPEELGLGEADVNELYAALDWLLAGQDRIEKKLAARHLHEGSRALYDVSSSFYYGRHCALAQFGHDRDKKGLPIIVYGMLTDDVGRPVAVQTYRGNTADPTTVSDQVLKLRERFGLSAVVLVGDRGMLTQTQIQTLKDYPGIGWISCLRSEAIRKLMSEGNLQRSLFDRVHLAEISSPIYPGERLVACFNPLLSDERRRKREELLAATEQDLDKIVRAVGRRTRTPMNAAEIGIRVGRVLHRRKMGKHFSITVADGSLQWERRNDQITKESELDGLYVIRTSEPPERLAAEDAVRHYKDLAQVERVFRCAKGDLRLRPIFHRNSDRVRAHIFLCMLAYYVEWHLRRELAPLLFHDEELSTNRRHRDPVAPAAPSASALQKKSSRSTADGLPVQSFRSLLAHMATRCRNTCRLSNDPQSPPLVQITEPSDLQRRAFELTGLFPVSQH